MIKKLFLLIFVLFITFRSNYVFAGIKDFNIYDGGGNSWEGYVIESSEYSTSKYYTPCSSTHLQNYDHKNWSLSSISTLNFFNSSNKVVYTTTSNNVHSTNYSSNYKVFSLTQEYSILFDLPIKNLSNEYIGLLSGQSNQIGYDTTTRSVNSYTNNFVNTLANNIGNEAGINLYGYSSKVSSSITSTINSSYSDTKSIELSESMSVTYNITNNSSETLYYAIMRRGNFKGYVTHYFSLVNNTSGVYKYVDSIFTFKFCEGSQYISCSIYAKKTNGKYSLLEKCVNEGYAYLDDYYNKA